MKTIQIKLTNLVLTTLLFLGFIPVRAQDTVPASASANSITIAKDFDGIEAGECSGFS